MITTLESRLTILVVIAYSLSVWLLVTVIVHMLGPCSKSGIWFPEEQEFKERSLNLPKDFKYHFIGSLVMQNIKDNVNDKFVCDAIIISRHWTLTAAKCTEVFDKWDKENIVIRSDSHDWKMGGVVHHILQYLVHKHYRPGYHDFDIAIIRVIEPLKGARVTYATLPKPTYQYRVNSTAAVLSWKMKVGNSTIAGKLQKTPVNLLGKSHCKTIYSDLKWNIVDTMLCAEISPNICLMKPGGPLVQNKIIIGLIVDMHCGTGRSAIVYLKMDYFQDSIEKVLNNYERYTNDEYSIFTDFISNFVQEPAELGLFRSIAKNKSSY